MLEQTWNTLFFERQLKQIEAALYVDIAALYTQLGNCLDCVWFCEPKSRACAACRVRTKTGIQSMYEAVVVEDRIGIPSRYQCISKSTI